MRILVVDDEPMTRQMVAHCLTEAGYEVEQAGDGREALQRHYDQPTQIVVSDWMMPEMDGPELCRAIRQHNSDDYVYFILLTQKDGTGSAADGLSAGADDFLTKPFDPQELAMRVRTGQRLLSLQSREMTIFALAKLAESRDPETGAHLERVRTYAQIIAQHLHNQSAFREEIDADYINLIYQTSPLHDIGKVAIPDSILLKPGALTDDEFETMKTHTTRGAETLDAALARYPGARFLKMARDIVLCHHEKYDGSGYPQGLSGEDIPLCGRIVAIADVFDALTTKRVYKDAFSHEKARGIILKDRGTHFDPAVVDAFLANEDRFIDTRERFADAPLAEPGEDVENRHYAKSA
jgi:putative two-component system response regulator